MATFAVLIQMIYVTNYAESDIFLWPFLVVLSLLQSTTLGMTTSLISIPLILGLIQQQRTC